VICGLSGGVDSSVAAALLHRAIGRRCTASSSTTACCGKGERVRSRPSSPTRPRRCGSSTRAERFLDALAGVTDPERKRKIIGNEFVEVFEVEAQASPRRFLAQGTLYPDVIESVSVRGPRRRSRATTTSAACPSG
jgi:GMP synthase (glutamine-hydrolysing)